MTQTDTQHHSIEAYRQALGNQAAHVIGGPLLEQWNQWGAAHYAKARQELSPPSALPAIDDTITAWAKKDGTSIADHSPHDEPAAPRSILAHVKDRLRNLA